MIVTLLASTVTQPVILFESITVSSTVTSIDPESVSTVPAGTPVFDALGNPVLLLTVIETGAETALLPARSRALAVSMCVPSVTVVESRLVEYGLLAASLPRAVPSIRIRTPATPTSSDASAVTVMVPDTIPPLVGEAIAHGGRRGVR